MRDSAQNADIRKRLDAAKKRRVLGRARTEKNTAKLD